MGGGPLDVVGTPNIGTSLSEPGVILMPFKEEAMFDRTAVVVFGVGVFIGLLLAYMLGLLMDLGF